MRATFLGHQGWLVSSRTSSVLVDPIVLPYFRNGGYSRAWVSPPRRLALRGLKIDALVLTHEHEDHFHLESIAMLPRSMRVLISHGFSAAGEQVLNALGFDEVVRAVPDSGYKVGADLSLTFLSPPGELSERGVVQPLFLGAGDCESFYNLVDCGVAPSLLPWLARARVERLGGLCVALNAEPWIRRDVYNGGSLRAAFHRTIAPLDVLGLVSMLGPLPAVERVAVVGGGFLDENAPAYAPRGYLASIASMFERLSHSETSFFAPVAGQTLFLGEEESATEAARCARIVAHDAGAEAAVAQLLNKAPPQWEAYAFDPVCGNRRLPSEPELRSALECLARALRYSRFHAEAAAQGFPYRDEKPQCAGSCGLRLYDDSGDHYYHYETRNGSIVACRPGLHEQHAFGFECWASDLLELMAARLGVYELIRYRCREWLPPQSVFNRTPMSMIFDEIFAPDVDSERAYQRYFSSIGLEVPCGGSECEAVAPAENRRP